MVLSMLSLLFDVKKPGGEGGEMEESDKIEGKKEEKGEVRKASSLWSSNAF